MTAVHLAGPALAGAATFPGPELDLYVGDDGAFNLAVPGEAQGLFEDGPGAGISPGQAGLAIYAYPVGASVGIGQPTGFESVEPPQTLFEDSDLRTVLTEFRVVTVEDSPVLDVIQLIAQSKTEPTVVVTHEISVSDAYGDNVGFRPYLLGNLTLDGANSASATWLPSPVPTLTVTSATTPRRLTVIDASIGAGPDPGPAPPTTVRFGSWADVALGPPGSGDSYGAFDGATRTSPAFGFEWSDWWISTLQAGDSVGLQTIYRLGPPPEPKPQRGVTAVAQPVSGTILVKKPGGRYEALDAGETIPVGSLVDTRKGTVRLTTSKGGGTDQSAIFKSGVFRLQQRKSAALTTLRLVGRLAGCRGAASRSTGSAPVVLRAGRSGRRLWGKGKGKFKISGKRGSGSVRGTTWQVTDRCNGSTVIKSIQGVVEARDVGKGPGFRRILKSGQSYVARSRR